jgi:type I restriction enzyme M protein
VESERAWKVDFKRIKSDAKDKAKPFWSEAEHLNDRARRTDARVRYLRDSLTGHDERTIRAALKAQLRDLKAELSVVAGEHKGLARDDMAASLQQIEHLEILILALTSALKPARDADIIETTKEQVELLKAQALALRSQAKDAQAAGDRLYWPIYNLDVKNPNAATEQSHDPDELLAQYKQLLGEIGETLGELKDELGAAMAHYVVHEAG